MKFSNVELHILWSHAKDYIYKDSDLYNKLEIWDGYWWTTASAGSFNDGDYLLVVYLRNTRIASKYIDRDINVETAAKEWLAEYPQIKDGRKYD